MQREFILEFGSENEAGGFATVDETLSERDSCPTIHVESLAEGAFEGYFAIELSGVRPASATGGHFAAAVLEHLLATPQAGERIVLRYACRPDSRRTEINFRIAGAATAPNPEKAVLSARCLYDRVRAMLAARRDCEFAAVPLREQVAASNCAYVAHPGLLFSLRRRVVCTAGSAAITSVLLPAVSRVESRVEFWRALAACPVALEVRVTIEPVALDGAACAAIAEAIQILRVGGVRIMDFPDRRALTKQELGVLNDSIDNALQRWLVIPRGVRLRVDFAASQVIPTGTLNLLARTLFQGRRVEIVDDSRDPRWATPGTLMLADCIHEANAFPSLLPDSESMSAFPALKRYIQPTEDLPTEGLILGDVGDVPVRLPERDRARHLYVIGSTGCGKSTVLLSCIRQDMDAGRGVCVIDPHGDLFAETLAAVPRCRAGEVLLLDAGDFSRAVGINFLEASGPNADLQRSFLANEMIKILDRMYDLKLTGGPMFEQYARGALGLLMGSRIPGLTLCEVPLVFEDDAVRKYLVEQCTNETVKRFWTRQADRATGEAALAAITPYITSKFNQYVSNALLRPIIGQSTTTIDFRAIMDSGKILLVNLSKGLLGQLDSSLLGMLIIGKIFAAAMGRARLSPEDRVPFSLYVDEFQNFSTETMGMLLAESRKYGVRLVLANQHLGQIDTGRFNLAASVLANVGTTVVMRLGAHDAERMASVLRPELSAQDLNYLPDFHAAVRLLHNGRPLRPFVFATRQVAPVPLADAKAVERIIRLNYGWRYARMTKDVEATIAERHRRLMNGELPGA